MTIQSNEEALRIAQQVIERAAKIDTAFKKMRASDMLGLECADAVESEGLAAENTYAARELAEWILKPPAPLRHPRIHLVVDRPDGQHSDESLAGDQITPAMLDAVEDLRHTLTTGERLLPKGLYELTASAFNITREAAKERLLFAAYGGKKQLW